MPKHKKKFISKKNALTFSLVHRSQQDPLVADENAPQHVLVPINNKDKKKVEEERKYGIFFDDNYDYLQHLKSLDDTEVHWEPVGRSATQNRKLTGEKKTVQLPSSVFASHVEEKVGLLNKAAPISGPRLDLDPDIVAAMDEDFDYDDPNNELEDNFIELANASADSNDSCDDSELNDEVPSLESGSNFDQEETKTKFTNYSMSSSCMRRNEQLTLLDDKFEKMFDCYESSEIGALDCEEIEGHVGVNTNEILLSLAENYNKTLRDDVDEKDVCKEKILLSCEADPDENSSDSLTDLIVVEDNHEQWDCESILSTYSNIYNHPAKITEPKKINKIKVSKTTGVPLNVIGDVKFTAKALESLNLGNDQQGGCKSVISNITQLSIRSKNESSEERRFRKKQLKVYRQERRMERKANTQAFKEEKKRQEKIRINVKNNLQGIKIE